MKKIKTIFKDLKVYQGKKFDDNRGFLREKRASKYQYWQGMQYRNIAIKRP